MHFSSYYFKTGLHWKHSLHSQLTADFTSKSSCTCSPYALDLFRKHMIIDLYSLLGRYQPESLSCWRYGQLTVPGSLRYFYLYSIPVRVRSMYWYKRNTLRTCAYILKIPAHLFWCRIRVSADQATKRNPTKKQASYPTLAHRLLLFKE